MGRNQEVERMDIGVIGSGNVGRTLAAGLAGAGHAVRLGSRRPDGDELARWSAATGVPLGTNAAVAAVAEVVVLATAWGGVAEALALAGADNLAGKVLIDVTNPLRFADGRLELAVGHDDSGGEQVQRLAPTARVVKAFNTVGFELMVQPALDGGPPTMFVAGDDPAARAVAATLAAGLGWGVHDCGDLRAARLTEPLALLWIEHARTSGDRAHALRWLGADS
ncbi:MAG: NADPH-dependent F420 reductase [Acidimicrobiia bacterium]